MSASIERIRAVVADALEEKGHGNNAFLAQIRNGQRDDGPFMIGALAWARKGGECPAKQD